MALREKARAEMPRLAGPVKAPPPVRLHPQARPARAATERAAERATPAERARSSIAMQKRFGNGRVNLMMGATAREAKPAPAPERTPEGVAAGAGAEKAAAPRPIPVETGTVSVTKTMPPPTAKEKPAAAVLPSGVEKAAAVAAPSPPSAPPPAKATVPEAAAVPKPVPAPSVTAPAAEAAPPTTTAKAPEPAVKPEEAAAAPKGEGKPAAARVEAPAEAKAEEAAPPSPREAIAPTIHAVHNRAARAQKRSKADAVVGNAQAAAMTPSTERNRSSAKNTVENLDSAKEKARDVQRSEFKAALIKAIDAATTPKPTTKEQADKVMKTGAAQANASLRGEMSNQREAATGSLKAASEHEAPASEDEVPQKKTELQPEQAGPPPSPVSAAPVVPASLPAERLDYSSDREPTDRAMEDAGVTKEQLAEGNEPEFSKTLEARSDAEKNEASAEGRYRQYETRVRDHAYNAAREELAGDLAEMHGARETRIGLVASQQGATKAKDASERERITKEITRIKDKTKADVGEILNSMEFEAAKIFEAGLSRAEGAYEKKFKEEKGGAWTWLTTWGEDWEELIENSLALARKEYMRQVDLAIDEVADLVDRKLDAAKKRVADGRTEVETFVAGLHDSVRHFGDEALESVSADFDAMVTEIDQRRDALVDKLAQQYKASYERMSAMEERLREENKSLWRRIYDATVGLIKKILAFKDMLFSILAKAASVVTDIIAHPIRFLGNLIDGVMLGLKNFKSNLGTHLKKGLMEWIFGALGGAGLQIPDTFDLQGIISIVLQVLGLTYANFRARAVAIVGEPIVSAIEKTAEVFKVIATEGVPGLWRFIKEKLSDLKSMVLDAILDFIKERVIIAGITWVIGLLNPASAFFKACKAIYDIVMFFINRGSQILALVNAIIDSMAAIARGSIEVAGTAVENALARAIPVAIGFLASLLGLGDISDTIKKIIEKAQAPINKAIDWVINQAVKLVKAVGGLLGIGKKDDPKAKGLARIGKDVSWTAGDESHTLWLELKGSNPVIVIASGSGLELEEVLDGYKKKAARLKDEKKKKSALENIAKATALLPAVKEAAKQEAQLTKQPDSDQKQVDAKEKEVESDEDKLGAAVREVQLALGLSVTLPPTIVKHTAGRVWVEPLSKTSGNTAGSPPSEDPLGWDLVLRVDRDNPDFAVARWSTRYMKRVHLLSQKLHGPGVSWNLVPGQQKLNSELEGEPESDAKTRTDSENPGKITGKEEVLYYDVKVEFHPGEPKGFPKDLSVTWGAMSETDGKWERTGEKQEFSRTDLEAPSFAGGKIPISGLARQTLRDYGFPDLLAQRIIDEVQENGAFTGPTDFLKRMNKRYDRETEKVNFEQKYWGIVNELVGKRNLSFK